LQVQHVLYEVTLRLMKLWTPIMPFTMEEVFRLFAFKDIISAQLLDYPKVEKFQESSLQTYQQFLKLKEVANKALEGLRSQNQIGSAQEAKISLVAPRALAQSLQALPTRERNRLFIVSQAVVVEGDDLKAEAMPAGGQKCPRCWNYFSTLHAHQEHQVCDRCLEVLST